MPDTATVTNPLITREDPPREWLVRCEYEDDELAVSAVWASNGNVEIVAPNDTIVTFSGCQIIALRDALASATEVAEADLRTDREARWRERANADAFSV